MRVYDTRALASAFLSYSGGSQCARTAYHLLQTIRAALKPHGDNDGSYELPDDLWQLVAATMAALPYGGRWVWQARKSYQFHIARAFAAPAQPEQLSLNF